MKCIILLILVRWKGNSEITLGSNWIGVDPAENVRRSKAERKIVNIPAPAMVLEYNLSMGGADVMDVFSCKHSQIRYFLPPITRYNSCLISGKTWSWYG